MTRTLRAAGASRAAALPLALLLAACQSSDRVAPDGATIVLTASPASILLSGGVQDSPVTILATVRNGIGVPLPEQDVRFTTTSGSLDPMPGTPVPTDDDGNAISILTLASVGPTITASSGKAMATLTITASTCKLASISISPSPIPVNSCSGTIPITATALDTQGQPCPNTVIKFEFVAVTTATDITLSFSPSSDTTDSNGDAMTDISLPNDCQTKCGGGNTCTGKVRASDLGGTVRSSDVLINDGV